VGVPLGRRYPGVTEDLLNHADVDTLRYQESRSRVPGVMNPGVPNVRLPEDGLPRSPVLGAFNGTARTCGEYQIVICPCASRLQPFRRLPFAVLFEEVQNRLRALKREVAEETGMDCEVSGLVGIYSDPGHVAACDDGEVRQEFSICFTTHLLGGTIRTSDESSDVRFVSVADLPDYKIHQSIRIRIDHYHARRAEPCIG
jgi:8-oxo-dGTP pyrophosphatase MutT (NUDIX family)